jgi:hypothetical protein
MPLVAHGLYVNLKVNWGTSLLGFVSVAFLPLPFALYYVSPSPIGRMWNFADGVDHYHSTAHTSESARPELSPHLKDACTA